MCEVRMRQAENITIYQNIEMFQIYICQLLFRKEEDKEKAAGMAHLKKNLRKNSLDSVILDPPFKILFLQV